MQRITCLKSQLTSASNANFDVVPEGPPDVLAYDVYSLWRKALDVSFNQDNPEQFFQILEELTTENVVFKAPTYWKTRTGRAFTKYALFGASKAFKEFRYTRKVFGRRCIVLEFECKIGEGGPTLRGVDLITFNDKGKITELEVMARPPKAVLKLGEIQTAFLRKMKVIK